METRRTTRGFGLVELIVVLGIIVLLLAILLPVLSGARRLSTDVTCRSRLREIAQAELMYANDNHGMLTLERGDPSFIDFSPLPDPPRILPGTNMWDWRVRLRNYLPLPRLDGEPDPNLPLGLVAPDVDDPSLVINCPVRSGTPGDSYSINDYMGPLPSNYDHFVSPWSYRVNRVKDSSAIIMLGDSWPTDYAHYPARGEAMTAPDAKDPTCIPAFRHGSQNSQPAGVPAGTANFAFVDGHVESLTYAETLIAAGHWKWW